MSLLDCLSGIIDTSIPSTSVKKPATPFGAQPPFPGAEEKKEEDIIEIKTAEELINEEYIPQNEKALVESSNLFGKQVEKDPTEKSIPIDPRKDYIKLKKAGLLPKTAGKGWANLPATELTPEILNHMKLLSMRK